MTKSLTFVFFTHFRFILMPHIVTIQEVVFAINFKSPLLISFFYFEDKYELYILTSFIL